MKYRREAPNLLGYDMDVGLGFEPGAGEFDSHYLCQNSMPLWYSWCVRRTENPEELVRFQWAAPPPGHLPINNSMKCSKCQYEIRGGKIFEKHYASCGGTGPRSSKPRKPGGKSWAKGLTKENDSTLQKISKANQGKKFPNRILEEETKQKISHAMKLAHAEDRAHNIGSNRWNNKPSYPEIFFTQVIENEFQDKNVVREYPLGRYSLDFAWPHLKRAIEIDGDQHERFEKQRESDARKDCFAIEAGWTILRVKWKEMFHEPKMHIARCKAFIDIPVEESW